MAVNQDSDSDSDNEQRLNSKWNLPAVRKKITKRFVRSSSLSQLPDRPTKETRVNRCTCGRAANLNDPNNSSDEEEKYADIKKKEKGFFKAMKRRLSSAFRSREKIIEENFLIQQEQFAEELRNTVMYPSPTFYRSPISYYVVVNSPMGSKSPSVSIAKKKQDDSDADEEIENPLYNVYPSWQMVSKQLKALAKHGWYWGPITYEEASATLRDECDGSFLVRDASDSEFLFTLSFRSYGKTYHTKISWCRGLYSLYTQPDIEFKNVPDLIIYSMMSSVSGVLCYSRPRHTLEPSYPLRLITPVSRFNRVHSLQRLCRFIIRTYTQIGDIDMLPLPRALKNYVH